MHNFGGPTKSIMVFLKVAYKVCLRKDQSTTTGREWLVAFAAVFGCQHYPQGMGPLQLSDHVIQNRQTGGQIMHWSS